MPCAIMAHRRRSPNKAESQWRSATETATWIHSAIRSSQLAKYARMRCRTRLAPRWTQACTYRERHVTPRESHHGGPRDTGDHGREACHIEESGRFEQVGEMPRGFDRKFGFWGTLEHSEVTHRCQAFTNHSNAGPEQHDEDAER